MKDKNISDYKVRIYQEDVDSGGIVYHSHYLKYAERARTEWLRGMGFEQSTLKSTQNCHFVVTHVDIYYKFPAYLDDLLEIRSGPCHIRGIRLVMSQKIFKKERMCVDMLVTLALINNEGKPIRLPDSIVKISQL
ncbi:MAG: YbgC/FadM family acyl-CoA thioesterase [Janthinobacterium lividum]